MRWRYVAGQEGRYEVSDAGHVRNSRTGRVLKPWLNKGYAHVNLGRGHRTAVHQLVAEAFIGARSAGTEVNHKNGQRDDNRATNLEWMTRAENIRHAHASVPRKLHAGAKAVAILFPGGQRVFNSTGAAAREIGADVANLSKALRNGWKVKGYEVNYV
jgi:hypothetical protein